ARIEMMSGHVAEEPQVVHDDAFVCLERIEHQLLEGLFESEWIALAQSAQEIPHAQESAATLLVQLPEHSGPTHAGVAGQDEDIAERPQAPQLVVRPLLCRT